MSAARKLIVDHMPHGAEVISPFDGRTLRIICLDSIIDKYGMDWRTANICSICPYTNKQECAETSCTGRIITTPETFALKILAGQIEAP